MKRLLAAAAVALTATTGSADAAKLTIHTTPRLTPSYSAGVPDYTVRCKPGTPVRLTASVPPRQSLSVDGQPAAEGSLTQDVNLEQGQAFRFTVNGTATHNVRCVPSDFPSWRVQRRGRPVAQWTVFAPTLKQFPPPNPPYSVISDRHGVPVWWKRAEGATPLDTRLLPDGTVTWGRLGGGFSQTYWDHVALDGTPLDSFNTVGTGADHHDFQMLPNGNHLMIVDTAREGVDLRRFGGPRNATVIDANVQELTPDGRLVWSWSTKDHMRLSETTAWGYKHARFDFYGKPAYDLTHLNAIDQHGNVLVVSCRKLRAVYGISRTSGRILWKMGGTHRKESLTLKRDPYGKRNFGGQHSAREAPDGTIYMHDNGSLLRSRARIVRYRLNLRKRTATLIESIDSGKHSLYSFCCGSAQLLPKGHWLISWGGNPIITELDHRHRAVLTLRFPGKLFSYWAQAVMPGVVTIDQLRAGMDAQFPREPQASP